MKLLLKWIFVSIHILFMTYLYKRKLVIWWLLYIISRWYKPWDGFCSQLHQCKFALTVSEIGFWLWIIHELYSITVPISTLVHKVARVSTVNFGGFFGGIHLGINLVYKVLAVEHFKQAIYCFWFTQFLNKCTGFFALKHIPKSVLINQSLIWSILSSFGVYE